MAANEMFESSFRTTGDLAGVFEYDGETGYFYLYETKSAGGQKVAAAIHILTGSPDFREEDVNIHWDSSERIVGLFIKQRLWAAFDEKTRAKYGGNYRADTLPTLPTEIVCAFDSK
jgi:hypothetical protein